MDEPEVLKRQRAKCPHFKDGMEEISSRDWDCVEQNQLKIARKCAHAWRDAKEKLQSELAQARQENERLKARFTAPIVCICGSTRFKQAWIWENARLTQEENIVLAVGLCAHAEGKMEELESNGMKVKLDALHKRKIDLCDWVWVIDVGGYIGNSTRSEIGYAESHGKPVRYLSKEFPDYQEPANELKQENERLSALNGSISVDLETAILEVNILKATLSAEKAEREQAQFLLDFAIEQNKNCDF